MAFCFKEKVVIVTGAAQGIGKQIALDFAKTKAVVCLFDVNAEQLEQTKKEIAALTTVDSFVVDVTSLESVAVAIDKIIDKYTKIDILINNAGITRDNLMLRMKEQDWDCVLNINLKGAFNCTKGVLKYMVKQRSGRIVNISSVIALMGNPGQTNYGASKAALIGMTKSLSKEVSSRGVSVNAIAPGYIATAMTDSLSPEVKEKMLQIIPMKRFGQPEDVSGAVMFLASGFASYITGKVLVVDGGML